MEFGSKQCKPSSPDCSICSLNSSCVAFNNNLIKLLPVKDKKTKITKKHFNFIVCISEDQKTILEQRVEKGIWHKLFQFPLIESQNEINATDLNKQLNKINDLKNTNYTFHLYNEKDIVHKLSHQHLYCKFWIVLVDKLPENSIKISEIENYAVPAVIEKFISSFNFETITIH